ncbi:MAG: HesA/MoeB/ThiF family protein [candidate division FCPU426 bacterium]
MSLTPEQTQRYARQIQLPEIGADGQARLAQASVLIAGLGGLGSAAAWYLAAAGVGRLGLLDSDRVEASNLQRQILHAAADVGRPKTLSAADKLRAFNPETALDLLETRATAENLPQLAAGYDFVIDATDNFPSKFLVSDVCVRLRKPFSHAGVSGFEGQTFTYLPGGQAGCYRCLFQSPPSPSGQAQDQSPAGILGTVAGSLGVIQATEAVKHLLGVGRLLTNRLLIYQALEQRWREVAFRPAPDCPACKKMERG